MRLTGWTISLCALLLCGCAGYQLGPTGGRVAGAKSIQVNLFRNETFEPRLTAAVGQALRKSLQQDATYRLSTRGDADVILTGTITDYDRTGLSYLPRDTITPRDFLIRMTAQVTAIERNTGRTLLDRAVTGRTTMRATRDFASSERQAVPLLADDLARNVTSLLVDGSW